jgi:hypothetical protein
MTQHQRQREDNMTQSKGFQFVFEQQALEKYDIILRLK